MGGCPVKTGQAGKRVTGRWSGDCPDNARIGEHLLGQVRFGK